MVNGNAAERRKQKRAQERSHTSVTEGVSQENNKPDERSNSDDEQDEGPRNMNRFPNSAVWTAIFTGILVIFTGLQVYINHNANQLNAANQRAIINAAGPFWNLTTTPDGKSVTGLMAQYMWTNSGRLPAKRLISEVNFSLGDVHPENVSDFSKLQQGSTIETVIGPGGQFQPLQLTISTADMKSVSEGRAHLFFWGWAIYDDGIPGTRRRLTEFCNDVTKWQFSSDDLTNPSTRYIGNWPPCSNHNCYDEQCEDFSARVAQYP